MTANPPQIDEVLAQAVEIGRSDQRQAFIEQACAGQPEIQREVERLVSLHFQAGSFLESPGFVPTSHGPERPLEPSGTQIGPYKLLQQIGEGGMGVVYMAEQAEPVARRVALKIIKPGMDTRQVIARFEAERQALAVMDHPNIARVIDAGTTDSGRPFFAMELVKGAPITQYCDEQHLTVRQRLELLVPVCQAIQHAHQKGIIHRDIKPTNVLVALYDGQPVPKVIDFGVAKATAQKLTARTMFTQFGQLVGTLEYMSPEQAQLNQLDIDTRSDIYSLGVLLYELLTGTTPFDKRTLKSAAFDEVLRLIREQEPPKPSTRLDSSDTLPSVAANRSVEPSRLSRAIRGELDWIVMKALEKDRSRRYETASAMATDLQRFLHDEPVQACPPSASYRIHKLLRRHRLAALVTTGFVLLLLAGIASSTYFALAAAARARESEANADQARKNLRKARAAVDQMMFRVASERLGDAPRAEMLRKKLLEDALQFHKEFLEEAGDDPEVRRDAAFAEAELARLQFDLSTADEMEQVERNLARAVGMLEVVVNDHPEFHEAGWKLVWYRIHHYYPLRDRQKPAEAEEQIRAAVELADRLFQEAPDKADLGTLAAAYVHYGEWNQIQRKFDEAEHWTRKSLALTREHHLEDYEGWSWLGLGGILLAQKRAEEAREAFEASRQAFDRFGARPNNVEDWSGKAGAMCGLSDALRQLEKADEADALLAEGIRQYELLVDNFPHLGYYATTPIDAQQKLARFLIQRGRIEDADTQLREAVRRAEKLARTAPLRGRFLRTAYDVQAQRVRMWKDAKRDQAAKEAVQQLKAFLDERSADPECSKVLADELIALYQMFAELQAEVTTADLPTSNSDSTNTLNENACNE